jgi:hypothetical protein
MIHAPALSAQQCRQPPVPESLSFPSQFLQPLFIVVVGFALQLPALRRACQSRQPASAAFAQSMLLPSDSHRGPLACRF